MAKVLPNHHITKPVYIGEVKADGQFNVVWKSAGLVPGDAWSDYLPGSKDIDADWVKLKCGNYNTVTKNARDRTISNEIPPSGGAQWLLYCRCSSFLAWPRTRPISPGRGLPVDPRRNARGFVFRQGEDCRTVEPDRPSSVRAVLTALLESRLYFRNSDQKVFIVKTADGIPSN